MSINMTKVSGLRAVFIYVSLGLLLLSTGCTLKGSEDLKPTVVDVPADEMISIPWNEGWTPALSITPGIPIELRGSDKVVYEISGDTNYLTVVIMGKLEVMSKTESIRKAEDRLYWYPRVTPEHLMDINNSWINIVRKEEGNSTGLVLVKVSPLPDKTEQGDSMPKFKADIIASLGFPRQDGEYQDISDEDLKKLEASYQN